MEATRIILFYSTLIFSIFVTTPFAEDTIAANQTIRDGVSTIESSGGVFELGFFSPGRSKNRYLGIWYKNISTGTVVWVANRETPISDTSGVLRMDAKGSLVLTNGGNTLLWSSNSSGGVGSPMAQLLDTGNLVIRYANDTDPGRYIWQSFDHPGDQLLPGVKLGWDLQNGINRYLTSWTSPDDPSPGNYTFNVNLTGFPQPLVWRNSVVQFRFGPWDGIKFSGTAFTRPNPNFVSNFVFDQKEIYYNFQVSSSFVVMRGVLGLDGNINLLLWVDQTQSWLPLLTTQKDDCDRYALCGSYGVCNITKSQFRNDACGCLKGFEPKNAEKWKLGNWSNGCVRKTQLGCGDGDGFIKYLGQKLPDTRRSWFNQTMDLEECKSECLKNCSCSAYSNIDIREGGVGCMLWFDDLLDIRDYREDVPDLYVRVAASELTAEASRSSRSKRKVTIIAIVVPVVVLAILLSLFIRYVFKKRKLRRKGMLTRNPESDATNAKEREDLDLPLCDFQEIADATNNFSQSNKLGEGGFGPVYKGILKEGQEIAVKRLSKSSRQGLDEFKNEVSCIAKLQHRNLVKLLGCCIEEGEMLLIYEFMPNKSLDSLIFDKELSKTLDWPKRYNIINGIARGLLYLHQDSRLRIIHRDLKASNILLDYEMNPKISDFGMARSFRGTESEANTTRVVGTFGYMSPEYALDGTFSVKSDVYSFGVLVLEIVSGTKMRGYYHSDPDLNLLGHAWRIYKEGKFLEVIDKTILESCNHSEVFRAIQIGLLCVQPYPEDRPTMSLVVLMLSSGIELPQPKQPAFITERTQPASNFSQMSNSSLSSSSITAPSPR